MSSAQEQIARVTREADQPDAITDEIPMEPDLHEDRTRQFTHTSFSRMRTTWAGDDAERMAEVKAVADDIIRTEFAVAFSIVERLRRHVRTPLLTDEGTGEIRHYPDGTPMWECDELGVPAEDWGQLSDRDRDGLLYTINLWLFEWELVAVDKWAEAMYAKVQWEERFAKGFIALPGMQVSGKPTIDDRTQWGHQFSAEERYFGVFKSALSKKADALVRSMNRLQRMLENAASR
jgi:hypothetical protein